MAECCWLVLRQCCWHLSCERLGPEVSNLSSSIVGFLYQCTCEPDTAIQLSVRTCRAAASSARSWFSTLTSVFVWVSHGFLALQEGSAGECCGSVPEAGGFLQIDVQHARVCGCRVTEVLGHHLRRLLSYRVLRRQMRGSCSGSGLAPLPQQLHLSRSLAEKPFLPYSQPQRTILQASLQAKSNQIEK